LKRRFTSPIFGVGFERGPTTMEILGLVLVLVLFIAMNFAIDAIFPN